MCRRIAPTSAPRVLAGRFSLDLVPDPAPRYDVAPGADIAAVVPDPRGERLGLFGEDDEGAPA